VVLSHGIVINNPVKFSLEKYRKIIEINQNPLLLVSELIVPTSLPKAPRWFFVSSIAGTTIGIRDAQPMRQARLRWSASPGAGARIRAQGHSRQLHFAGHGQYRRSWMASPSSARMREPSR
jgi:hypothetical protein